VLQSKGSELQPSALAQPGGQETYPDPPGQLAVAPHATSQAQDESQRVPTRQLSSPEQSTSQAPVPQLMPNAQLVGPMQSTSQDAAAPQSTGPQALSPKH
jgi:hypothetical protein